MDSLLLFLAGIITMFGLWQLDWALWVDKIDAFQEYVHIGRLKENLSLIYLSMMLSPVLSILISLLSRNRLWILLGILFFLVSLRVLIWKKQTAPGKYRISLWGPVTMSVEDWIILNTVYVLSGLSLAIFSLA